jgi:glycosyltransferase involved in cell wall biosynthesis
MEEKRFKKILLISNHVYHYRINNYNYFTKKFKQEGYSFQVLATGKQDVDFGVDFPLDVLPPNFSKYKKYIDREKPDVVIFFMHLKDKIIFPLMYYCKWKRFPVIYWNFGINTFNPDSYWKNYLYYHLHKIADGIILYSPNELKYIRNKNKRKTFIGYNTLNMTELKRNEVIDDSTLKTDYGVKEKYIVLFVGRIIGVKNLDALLNCFRNDEEIAVVIVGKGIKPHQQQTIEDHSNYYYLGEVKYDKHEIAKIFKSCDFFCIPGNLGLAIIEAFFWGKPVITLDGYNSPEIYYLKHGQNGFIVNDEKEMEETVRSALADKDLYNMLSENAQKTADTDMHIDNMFNGFLQAVNHVQKKA